MTARRVVIHLSDIRGITRNQAARLKAGAIQPGRYTVSRVSTVTGTSKRAALAILLMLIENRAGFGVLLVYHVAHEEPVAERKISEGFITVPWICPTCAEEVTTKDDISYALEVAVTREVVWS